MFSISKKVPKSELFDQGSFYSCFIKDLKNCRQEVVIESPFITASRMELLYPIFHELLRRGVNIHMVTRDPTEHRDEYMRDQATNEILYSKGLGINIILLTGFHHRKLAIIDRTILWEGSLNILSHSFSQEVMRRTENTDSAKEMFDFLKLKRFM